MIIYYPFAITLAYLVYSHATQATVFYQEAVMRLDLTSQTELAWKSFLEALSLNLYEGASVMKEQIAVLNEQAVSNLQQANMFSLMFLGISIAYLSYLFYFKKSNKDSFAVHVILIGFICLVVGLSTTMLNLIAFRELPVVGMIVFKFESKSIVSILATLWQHGKYFVFLLIMIFSVLIPLLKILLSLFVVLIKKDKIKNLSLACIHKIGKWSMTDVFVIAILLAFFTMNVDETTDAWLGHGLYFFAAYSLLSIWASHIISKRKMIVVDL